ncbi:MAG: DsrE/DsrF-like family protein [Bacteroidetes bacterium ADurb.Bin408]|nr:MAG: DsrE/DsrF-like family protein [Bacteroidetes bacterium ADurb.Bin408]
MVFKQNKMGHGADDLGTILMKAFVNTLPELNYKPKTLIFLNTGIYLALNDSPVIEALKNAEKQGVNILVCGTCLNYFGKKDDLGVGIVSNMYDIMECMSKADKVIHP